MPLVAKGPKKLGTAEEEQNGKAKAQEVENEEKDESFVLVSNIPSSWHTHHLRRHFSGWVENESFSTFHFRHRPEKGKDVAVAERAVAEEQNQRIDLMQKYSEETCTRVHLPGSSTSSQSTSRPTTCCIARLPTSRVVDLIKEYHRKHWQEDGVSLPSRCFVSRITLPCPGGEEGWSAQELKSLPELTPPNIMPRGNVGTSTAFFLEAIKTCRLPAKIIGKLKLDFPQRRRKYGEVPPTPGLLINRAKLDQKNAAGPSLESVNDDGNVDNDTCEEWERHEALHNDVQPNRSHANGQAEARFEGYVPEWGDLEQQSGTKNITYEDEIELVWEKGGSGLNFYTDAAYWKAQEGDFDEKTADDWDVDMSVYYEKEAGVRAHDKDAVDSLDMRRAEFLHKGKHSDSVFGSKRKNEEREPRGRKKRNYWTDDSDIEDSRIGSFESHSKGVASRIMAKSGWQTGEGLGVQGRKGTATPVMIEEDEGQGPRDKRGIGYYGEKLATFLKPAPKKPPPMRPGSISTCYTAAQNREPKESVDRSVAPIYMKFRDQSVKFHKGGVEGGNRKSSLGSSGEGVSGSLGAPGTSQPESEVKALTWEERRRKVELGGEQPKERYPQLGKIDIEDLDL